MSILGELRRRNVIRVATAYAVTAWLIIQVIETIFPAFGFTDSSIRITVIILGIGFVPTVIAAWAFEWTPGGLKRDVDARESVDRATASNRWFDRAIVVVLALGIAYFAVDKFVFAPEREAEVVEQAKTEAKAEALTGFYGDRSIAVLPFDNLSPDPDQVYFVDGVAEEILNLLARIRDLRVISRSSSFAFRDQDLEVPEIGERLNVAHVLEGSVRRAGNRVRVTAQLIEARTDTHLWSKTYDKELDDVFLIQDEIAADVAKNLEIRLLHPLPHSRNVNPEAYGLVQQVKQIFEVADIKRAERMYPLAKRAFELDPDYPEAVRWLSIAEWLTAAEAGVPWQEVQPRYTALIARYAELVPDSGYLDFIEALELERAGEFEQAAPLFLSALEKALTDSGLLRHAGMFALLIDRPDTALRLVEHAVAIDPLCHQCRRVLTQVLLFRGEPGDYQRGKDVREQYLAVAAGGGPFYSMLLILLGEPDKVAAVWDSAEGAAGPQELSYRAMANHSMGRKDEAQQELARIEEMLANHSDDGTDPGYAAHIRIAIAQVAAWFGDADKAFAHLLPPPEKIRFTERLSTFDPVWRGIHDDPRWLEYRAAIGMSPERLEAIEFDPWLPE